MMKTLSAGGSAAMSTAVNTHIRSNPPMAEKSVQTISG
jgi:hypothetical protein